MTLLHAMRSSAIDDWGHSYSSLIWLTKRRICTSRLHMKADGWQVRECDILDLETKSILNLGLDSCYRLTNQGMSDILDRCFKLRCIDIRGCMQMTDVGVSALGYRCHQLQSINLSFCVKVTDAGISALGAGCGKLQSIDLTGCDEVTDSGVSALGAGCGQL
jgi:Leucine Rich repeat